MSDRAYGSNNPTSSLIRLCRLLATEPSDLPTLATRTGLSKRQTRRLLAQLADAGVPLRVVRAASRGGPKVYSLPRDLLPRPVTLDALDAIALRVLLVRAKSHPGEPFHAEITNLEAKLSGAFEPHGSALYDELQRILPAGRAPAPDSSVQLPTAPEPPSLEGAPSPPHECSRAAELAEELVDAIRLRQVCDIRYMAADGRERRYAIHPLAMHPHSGRLYLTAWVPVRRAYRELVVHRFLEVRRRTRDARFEPPADYRPDERVTSSFGVFHDRTWSVRVRLAPQLALRIREQPPVHPTQRLRELSDGSLELTFQAEGRPEILAWVLYWGELAELLEPVELREELTARLRRTLAAYERSSQARQDGRLSVGETELGEQVRRS